MYATCRTCSNARTRDWNNTPEGKVWHLNEQRTKRYTLADWVDTFKDKPCTDCGVKYPPYVMDFDHLPEFTKLAAVPKLINLRKSKKLILEEMQKCELVCSNCHRIRTKKRGQWGGRHAVID